MKHLRKDDGYVLIYVLIVFTILSFVAVSICTMALKNLQAQKADVARMEARYEAEGYLQQFIAEKAAVSSEAPLGSLEGEFGVKAAIEGELSQEATDAAPVETTVLMWNVDGEGAGAELHQGDNWVDVKVTALNRKEAPVAQIVATLRISVTVEDCLVASGNEDNPLTPEDESKVTKYTYKVTGANAYESYDISYSGGDE